jgi:hypothetical protein
MLDGLDQIDWASLQDAYGPATEFPRRLRAVLSSDKAVRESAFGELLGSIVHQGTVYEATAFAVPFIIEILRMPPPEDAEWVAVLLASSAEGHGYLEMHTRLFNAAFWEKSLAKRGTTLEAEQKRERRIVRAVRDAVADGLDLLLPYLSTGCSTTRLAVASALALYPVRAAAFLPALESALQVEEDEEVRAEIEKTIGTLRSPH